MNEDYTQPFYVPVGKGRINPHTGRRGGYYLPALEPKSDVESLITPIPLWTNKQWYIVNQLRSENKHLSKKLFKALNLITAFTKKRDDSYEPF